MSQMSLTADSRSYRSEERGCGRASALRCRILGCHRANSVHLQGSPWWLRAQPSVLDGGGEERGEAIWWTESEAKRLQPRHGPESQWVASLTTWGDKSTWGRGSGSATVFH